MAIALVLFNIIPEEARLAIIKNLNEKEVELLKGAHNKFVNSDAYDDSLKFVNEDLFGDGDKRIIESPTVEQIREADFFVSTGLIM